MKSLEQLLGLQKAYKTTTTTNDGGAALTEFLGVQVTYDINKDYEFTVDGKEYFLDDSIIENLVEYIGWTVKDVVVKAFELAEENLEDDRAKRLIMLIFEPLEFPGMIDMIKFYKEDNKLKLLTWDDGPRGTLNDIVDEYFFG